MKLLEYMKRAVELFRRINTKFTPRTPCGMFLYRFGQIFIILVVIYGIMNLMIMPIITRHGQEFPLAKIEGLTVPEARPILSEAGLSLQITSEEYHPDKPTGTILTQFPVAGTMVKSGRTVKVVTSLGQKDVEIPDLRGFSVRQATLNLEAAGFVLGQIEYTTTDSLPENVVVFSFPAAGQKISYGSAVSLLVNRLPNQRTVLVPKLVGMSLADATRKLGEAGLRLGVTTRRVDENFLPETVLEQSDEPGTELFPGESVDLIVSSTD